MLSFSKNVLLLLFLYFIQGLPYGFQSQFLPLHLRSLGHDLTNVSLMRLLHAPWLCKALWAPLVDKYGTKRKWLLGSIIGLIFTCLIGGFISTHNITLLCVVLFLLNLFASTQDIAVDGIAVALLGSHELGSGNTAQVVGYKIGSIFGGGVLVWFMDQLGWFGLFMALTFLYIEALMFVYVSPSLRYLESRLKDFDDANNRIVDWQNKSYDFKEETPEWEDYVVENEKETEGEDDTVTDDGLITSEPNKINDEEKPEETEDTKETVHESDETVKQPDAENIREEIKPESDQSPSQQSNNIALERQNDISQTQEETEPDKKVINLDQAQAKTDTENLRQRTSEQDKTDPKKKKVPTATLR